MEKEKVKVNSADLSQCRLSVLKAAYKRGLKVENLGSQPTPWVFLGLQKLEQGSEVTVEDLKKFDCSGGTGHPDPWFT